MNPLDSTVLSTISTPLAKEIIRIVFEHVGYTGWQIARQVNKPSVEVKETLDKLVSGSVVKAQGQGLDAYYIPSGAGYLVKQQLLR